MIEYRSCVVCGQGFAIDTDVQENLDATFLNECVDCREEKLKEDIECGKQKVL